jgi:hypothetical protein
MKSRNLAILLAVIPVTGVIAAAIGPKVYDHILCASGDTASCVPTPLRAKGTIAASASQAAKSATYEAVLNGEASANLSVGGHVWIDIFVNGKQCGQRVDSYRTSGEPDRQTVTTTCTAVTKPGVENIFEAKQGNGTGSAVETILQVTFSRSGR